MVRKSNKQKNCIFTKDRRTASLLVASHHQKKSKRSADWGVVLHLQLVQRSLGAEAVVAAVRPPRARPRGRHGALGRHPRRPLRDGRPGEAHVAGDGGDGRHGRDRREQAVGEREAVLRVGVVAGGGALLGRAHGPELGLGGRGGGHVPRELRRVAVAVPPRRRARRPGEGAAGRAAEPVDDVVVLTPAGAAGVRGLVRHGDVLVEGLRADPLLQPAPALVVQRVRLVVPGHGHGGGGRPPEAQLLVAQGGVLQRAHALEGRLLLAPRHGAHLFLGEDAAVPPLVARLLLLLHGSSSISQSVGRSVAVEYSIVLLQQ
jgi:hypothetical protein